MMRSSLPLASRYAVRGNRKGFALVATIAVMALLVLLAVSMLTLSTVEIRTASQSDAQAEARANARMALMLALGELQKNAGPDQRVTAEASILETSPLESPAAKPVANPHWVGVWRTDKMVNGSGSTQQGILHRRAKGTSSQIGSLADERSEGGYDKNKEMLSLLVSHPDDITPDAAVSLDPADRKVVTLVGSRRKNDDGLSSAHAREQEVYSYRVPVADKDKREKGGYAWWVGDEGVKARFDLVRPDSGLAKDNPSLFPLQSGVDSLQGYKGYMSVSDDIFGKLLSRRTPELYPDFAGGGNALSSLREARQKNYHTLSFHSRGLLTDSLRGGLKKDLSAFLRSKSGSVPALGGMEGLEKGTPIIGADDPLEKLSVISPKFGLIHHWNEIGRGHSLGGGLAPLAPEAAERGFRWKFVTFDPSDPWRVETAPDIAKQDRVPLHPVMVEASISYGVSITEIGGAPAGMKRFRPNVHYFPRVVLYNPYKVKLKRASYAVQIFMPHDFNVQINRPSGSPLSIYYLDLNTSGQMIHDGDNMPHHPIFTIPNVELEPGECLLFTADGGSASHGSRYWGDEGSQRAKQIQNFPLTCTASSPLNGNFWFYNNRPNKCFNVNATEVGDLTYQIVTLPGRYYKHYIYRLFLNKNPSATASQVANNPTDFPPLQTIVQTEDGAYSTDCPHIQNVSGVSVSRAIDLYEIGNSPVTPSNRFKWGHRIQWLDDTSANVGTNVGNYGPPYLDYNVLANHNLRAGWHMRSPIENVYRASSAGGRYAHGILIDDVVEWSWSDAKLAPVPAASGKNRVSPFGYPASFGGETFPLLDVPSREAPFTSLGMLQHAPFSQFPWHPTYAFGNSLADPRVARDATSNYVTAADWDKIGGIDHSHSWSMARQAVRSSSSLNGKLNNSAFLYDISYELNHALWDRYFLSTIDDKSRPTLLLNPRLALNADAREKELLDFHKAARNLSVLGAFNVNSTNKDAWKLLLASFRDNGGLKIVGEDGTFRENDLYSRYFSPYKGKEYTSQGAMDPETWKGYRHLSDAQIDSLATEIVKEVKLRGPFLSLSDFVNRRLVDDPNGNESVRTRTGLKGSLQAAIDRTDINRKLLNDHPIAKVEYSSIGLDVQAPYNGLSFTGVNSLGPKPNHHHWADSKLVGAPGFLTQADVLQKLGSVLTARSDTFVIRCYGDSVDGKGNIRARVWCEALVQRVAEPFVPDASGLNPHDDHTAHPSAALGRKFKILTFRWLNPDEV